LLVVVLVWCLGRCIIARLTFDLNSTAASYAPLPEAFFYNVLL